VDRPRAGVVLDRARPEGLAMLVDETNGRGEADGKPVVRRMLVECPKRDFSGTSREGLPVWEGFFGSRPSSLGDKTLDDLGFSPDCRVEDALALDGAGLLAVADVLDIVANCSFNTAISSLASACMRVKLAQMTW
jgi:hypothetical protein